MTTDTAGFFWLKYSVPGGASHGTAGARVESALEYVQPKGGDKFIEGYTIRLQARVAMGKAVAMFTFLAPATKAEAMPISFYVDQTDPNKQAKRFKTDKDALDEQKRPEFEAWARGGVVVLAALGLVLT